jgi:hypothetical protein
MSSDGQSCSALLQCRRFLNDSFGKIFARRCNETIAEHGFERSSFPIAHESFTSVAVGDSLNNGRWLELSSTIGSQLAETAASKFRSV